MAEMRLIVAGAVSTTGMQFIGSGWTVGGDAVTLDGTGGSTTIRVGDGTAAGASSSAAIDSALTGGSRLVKGDLGALILLLIVASVTGNTLNYAIGRAIGPAVFNTRIRGLERFLDRAALQKTHDFYVRHGGKTIVLARFIPVVRTFAQFVAGVSQMSMKRFQFFNFAGAFFWVLLLVLLGYFFGNIPFIRNYLNVIVLVGIGAAVVPVIIGGVWKMLRKNTHRDNGVRRPDGNR